MVTLWWEDETEDEWEDNYYEELEEELGERFSWPEEEEEE